MNIELAFSAVGIYTSSMMAGSIASPEHTVNFNSRHMCEYLLRAVSKRMSCERSAGPVAGASQIAACPVLTGPKHQGMRHAPTDQWRYTACVIGRAYPADPSSSNPILSTCRGIETDILERS